VDVKRAANLYNRVIACARSVPSWRAPWTAVSHQLPSAGITMRTGLLPLVPLPHNRSLSSVTKGLTWAEVAKQVDMTVSGAWSRYRRPGSRSPHAWAGGSRCSPTPLTRTLHLASVQPSLTISVEHSPQLTFHGLRHSAASLMLAGGADIYTVSKLLGHRSISITADVYAHLVASVGQRAVDGAAALITRSPKQDHLEIAH
jgi:hypothetical protein